MSITQMQAQRLEMKYVIPEQLAVRIRDFIRPYLEIDSYGATRSDLSYPVHSLYLDSPDLHTYNSTINGDRNRYKLRIRFYEGRPDAPVFFEIKRREDNAIYKQRCAVRRGAAADLLAGRIPDRRDLIGGGPDAERALHAFSRLINQLRARPITHVAYQREAWTSRENNRTRITFDRRVLTCRESALRFDTGMLEPVCVFGNEVVLELKFTGRFPNWMGDLTRVFGLKQSSAAKYCDGLDRIREHVADPLLSLASRYGARAAAF
jgi:hypothetical protein